jgi:hypothetical protein
VYSFGFQRLDPARPLRISPAISPGRHCFTRLPIPGGKRNFVASRLALEEGIATLAFRLELEGSVTASLPIRSLGSHCCARLPVRTFGKTLLRRIPVRTSWKTLLRRLPLGLLGKLCCACFPFGLGTIALLGSFFYFVFGQEFSSVFLFLGEDSGKILGKPLFFLVIFSFTCFRAVGRRIYERVQVFTEK